MKWQLKKDYCPGCGKLLDGVGEIDSQGMAPVEGDFTICIQCAVILTFDSDLKLQIDDLSTLTPEELCSMRQLEVRIKAGPLFQAWDAKKMN